MRYFSVFLLLFLSVYVSANQEWKFSSCHPNQATANAFDCGVVTDSPASWCYASLAKKDEIKIHYIMLPGLNSGPVRWVKCAYRHKWNRQGAINWATNIGSEECPEGKILDPVTQQCISDEDDECKVGNPINITQGNKVQREVDFSLMAYGKRFDLERNYNSKEGTLSSNVNSLQKTWRFKYEDHLVYLPIYRGAVKTAPRYMGKYTK